MSKPKITSSLLPDPQLTMYVKALGILCFNHRANRAEIGFLKVEDHAVIGSFYNRNGDPPAGPCCRKIKGPKNFMGSGGSIEIFKNGCSAENFDRVINLADIYGREIEFKDKAKFTAKMFIENAVFSIFGPSFVRATPFPISGPGLVKPAVEIGRTLKIQFKDIVDYVVIEGSKIPLDPNGRYDLVIDSDCRSTVGDFQFFFDVLKGAGDTRYNIRFEKAVRLFTSGQDAELGELLDELEEFLKRDKVQAKDDSHEKQFEKMLNLLACLKGARCDPAGCCLARIDGKSLFLP